jgi:hypothetical protein
MFSLLKYIYFGSEKVETQPEKVVDNEPEIIDSYVSPIENNSPTNTFIMPPFIKPTIEEKYASSFVTPKIFPQTLSLTENILKKLSTVYLVLKKSTGEPLGIYDTLDKAKELGQKATYHNCTILEYRINDPCKYLRDPVFENK